MNSRKSHSPLTRQKISLAMKNRVLSSSWKVNVTRAIIEQWAKAVICNETGKTFESISEAARCYGLAPTQVSRVCRGMRNSVHGLTFSFL